MMNWTRFRAFGCAIDEILFFSRCRLNLHPTNNNHGSKKKTGVTLAGDET